MDALIEPKQRAEFVINPLRLDPSRGWTFSIVCDREWHDTIGRLTGVRHSSSYESDTVHVYIDPRYTAHDVYVYVGCWLTREAELVRIMREAVESTVEPEEKKRPAS